MHVLHRLRQSKQLMNASHTLHEADRESHAPRQAQAQHHTEREVRVQTHTRRQTERQVTQQTNHCRAVHHHTFIQRTIRYSTSPLPLRPAIYLVLTR
jgi:hypothetical protein